jgi:hypothetical protein
VVFLDTDLEAQVSPAGWHEWHSGETHSLDTAFYAEYHSAGPGANPSARDTQSHQLTEDEAQKFSPENFLHGDDGWNPEE